MIILKGLRELRKLFLSLGRVAWLLHKIPVKLQTVESCQGAISNRAFLA